MKKIAQNNSQIAIYCLKATVFMHMASYCIVHAIFFASSSLEYHRFFGACFHPNDLEADTLIPM